MRRSSCKPPQKSTSGCRISHAWWSINRRNCSAMNISPTQIGIGLRSRTWAQESGLVMGVGSSSQSRLRCANALAHLNLLWLEDPTPITNPDSCAQVRERSPIPIWVGEMFIAEQFRLFIDHQACDILHPDVLFSGGLHELRRIADYAELNHFPVAIHG